MSKPQVFPERERSKQLMDRNTEGQLTEDERADLESLVAAIGRATAAALDFNHPRRIRIRQAEETFDLFPPNDP
jgi:hypothetical protein